MAVPILAHFTVLEAAQIAAIVVVVFATLAALARHGWKGGAE